MQNVLFASTLHDPNGSLLEPLSLAVDVVLSNYRGWVLNITTTTDPRVKELLKDLEGRGIYSTEPDPKNPIVENKIENDHLNVLREAITVARKLGINKIQYTDGDRIVVAGKYFPNDLSEMAKIASDIGDTNSYLNLRRSPEDYFTHHPPLVETEFEINRLYSQVFGTTLDITSTAHVMSRDVVEEILRRSPQMEPVDFPPPKWLLIAKETDAEIRSLETHNVLTFETPEQHRTQVSTEIAGDYHLLQQAYMATLGLESYKNPKEWRLRFETERQYIGLLRNHLEIFGFNPHQKESLQKELQVSLKHLEGLQKAVIEALEGSGKGPER